MFVVSVDISRIYAKVKYSLLIVIEYEKRKGWPLLANPFFKPRFANGY